MNLIFSRMKKHKAKISNWFKSKVSSAQAIKTGAIASLGMLALSVAAPSFAISQQEAQSQISSINSQINNLNNSLAANQQKQQSIQDVIDGINIQIQKIQLQLNETQAQIDLTNSQIDDTNAQIAKTEADLAEQKKIMAGYLKVIYMNDQTSLAELIITSNSFSDFVDRSEYLNTMQQKVKETEDKIADLEKQLQQKKKDLDAKQAQNVQLKASQQAQQASIVAQQNYQKSLLADAKSAANALSNQKDALYAKKAQLSAAFNETTVTAYHGGSSYPYGNPPASGMIDRPDGYGYAIGECTSYAAWKRASVGRPVPRTLGNANTWGVRAAAQGYSVNSTPKAGDVMVFPYLQPYGHVAYVEAVYGNGTILISEYNWSPYRFDERVINPYNYGGIFIH